MRSRSKGWRLLATTALTMWVAVAGTGLRSQPAPAAGEVPGQDEIARALEAVKADPNLAAQRTVKVPQWKTSDTPAASGTPTWMTWLANLFRWLAESARVLMWCAAGLMAALLARFLIGLVRDHSLPHGGDPFVAPTHVGTLDIRPETLPADIGAAARALWDRGEHRAALALLYRGLLSRLAHVHRVPIRDSSTEGDCLALAASHLPPARGEYASRLVRVWQRAVYGREAVETPMVHALCDAFASELDAAVSVDALASGSTT